MQQAPHLVADDIMGLVGENVSRLRAGDTAEVRLVGLSVSEARARDLDHLGIGASVDVVSRKVCALHVGGPLVELLRLGLCGLLLAVILVEESSVSAEARKLRGAAKPLPVTLVNEGLVGAHSASVGEGDVVPGLLTAAGGAGALDVRKHLHAALSRLTLAVELGDESAVGALLV